MGPRLSSSSMSMLLLLVLSGACALQAPLQAPRPAPALAVRHSIRMSLFSPERLPSPEESRRSDRLEMVASRFGLDPVDDSAQIVALAASSLPDEENGTWLDLGVCALQNIAVVALLLAAVGALPGQASAAEIASEIVPSTTSLLADAESNDVIAIIAVPLLVSGVLVAALAVGYPILIRKIQQGDR